MTLRHIRIFLAVCDCGSMTEAARHLFMSQPSVSQAIREMEEYYGVRLFDRISKRLYLTEPGQRVLQYGRHIVSLMDEMEGGLKEWEGGGCLRVGTSITIGTYLLPECVRKLEELYPDLQVEARIDNSESIEQYVLDNEIDVGVIEGIAHSPYLVSQSFPGDRLVFICPPGHRFAGRKGVSLGELQEEKFLLREKGSAGREIFDGLAAAHELKVHLCWQSASNQAIIHAVSKGLGISLLPSFLAGEHIGRGEIASFQVEGLSAERKFTVIRHKNKLPTQGVKELVRLMTQGTGQCPGS